MTSAAPMYFTEFEGYIDGGIKANNPCELAMVKIREYYNSVNMTLPHFPVVVSIGTGVFPSQKLDNMNMSIKTGLDGFATMRDLFNLFIYAVSTQSCNF